ncbi:MAG TPA: hypothetical protein VIK91_03010, partial [Nannocystis sp.]
RERPQAPTPRRTGPAARVLAAALAVSGCGETAAEWQQRIGERLQKGLTSTDKKRPGEPDRLPPELVLNKLRLYVDCVNATRVPFYDAYRVGAAAFAGKTRTAPAAVPQTALDACAKAERDGPLLKPPLPALEQALSAYYSYSRGFSATIEAVREDMSHKSSSILAEGERSSIYNNFSDAYRRWDEARRTLDEQIDARQSRLEAAVLAEIEARAGAGLEWHSRNVAFKARPHARCLDDHDEFTAGVCTAYYNAFEAAYAEFRAAYDSDPVAAARVFWMPQFARSLGEYADAAAALTRAIRDGKARAADIGAVVREYHDAVHDSELLGFTRPG